ncbi:hypothetical protein CkaCkLH20_08873 [Colletotrichum karsti]|uniref:Uncharacterized protein n=1 Tax=Colletotrichum karsti TaxID=1095194 RepID=A0A9P6LHN1_9PEZI|nr:uncharacterized protein CkaCkLH20_08873 [Colletotrichum karsti]KAF9873763.1 hypothetical protein CkaCkLH20_08873 [Colletotrichum karsti]
MSASTFLQQFLRENQARHNSLMACIQDLHKGLSTVSNSLRVVIENNLKQMEAVAKDHQQLQNEIAKLRDELSKERDKLSKERDERLAWQAKMEERMALRN